MRDIQPVAMHTCSGRSPRTVLCGHAEQSVGNDVYVQVAKVAEDSKKATAAVSSKAQGNGSA